jgi:hypothetical protein
MVVGIDTIASDDGGHRGTGGGGGEEQGWIEYTVSTKRYVRSVAERGVSGHRGRGGVCMCTGKCIYVQMIPMRINMVQGRLG